VKNLIGKPPINAFVFYTGKFAGYVCWILLVTSITGVYKAGYPLSSFISIFSLVIGAASLILILISLLDLGDATRLGVPSDDTSLKTGGIYRFSRNPMYLGFDLLTISSILYTSNLALLVLGIYSLITYHFIIKGEEKFLYSRFGDEYEEYCKNVKRYL
jgi:protein-S-isoprenylcysteine O-methyltransferase Ste14